MKTRHSSKIHLVRHHPSSKQIDSLLRVSFWTICQASNAISPLATDKKRSGCKFFGIVAGYVLCLLLCLSITDCGGGGNGSGTVSVPPPPTPTIASVTVSPATAAPIIGTAQQYTATVQGTGSFSSAVTWMVNNIPGGNATVGTISGTGLYAAPGTLPSPSTVTIQAVSTQDNTKSGTATATVSPENVQVAISPSSASVQLGATQKFTVTVTGAINTSYVLTVNGQPTNPSSTFGNIDFSGLCPAPT